MASPWSVPRLWPGATVAILATGASLTQDQVDAVRGLPVIAINDAFRLAPWAAMLYAADTQWWRVNAQDALQFQGLKVTAHESCEFKAVQLLRRTGTEGFDEDPRCLRTGGNSGYQALHVALHAGAARILLLGYDMGGPHFFGRHRAPLRNTDPATFVTWMARFRALAGRGAEVVNCTPGSALSCFPRMDLAEALELTPA